jgi:hypothetical protein
VEIDAILLELEAAVARRSIFVSGSYPEDVRDEPRSRGERIATSVGDMIAHRGLRLVSGFGLTVGSAVVAGLLGKLYAQGVPSLDRSLYLRPFPQVTPAGFEEDAFRRRYREDMMQQAGICIFIGGTRQGAQGPESAPGVIEEYEIARALGKVIIPVAMTGGSAGDIWSRLAADGGADAAHLPGDLFRRLGQTDASVEDTCTAIAAAVDSATGTS